MLKTTSARIDRNQQLNRLHTAKILKLYNEAVGNPSGTIEDRGMPKEEMVRTILLHEGYLEPARGIEDGKETRPGAPSPFPFTFAKRK